MAIIFFWKYKNTRPSRFLNLSTKQTVRYLHKWMDEGWLTFISGKGRETLLSPMVEKCRTNL